MTRLSLCFAAALAAAPLGAAVEFSPVAMIDASAGFSRFSGDRLEGPNGSLLFVPGLRFGGRLSLLPILSADYQKARDVQELAGGGFLTQAQHARGGSLRLVMDAGGGFKLKTYASYREQLIKETRDEPWGKGLFDYSKTAGGLELARESAGVLRGWSVGTDFYATRFPNADSLASRNVGQEVNAGKHTLDFHALDLPFSADISLAKTGLRFKGLASLRRFADQKVVDEVGSFPGEERQDVYVSASAEAERVLPSIPFFGGPLEWAAGVSAGYARLDSNQNNYDATATAFNPDYYSYDELSAGPSLRLRHGKKTTIGLGYSYVRRAYAERPAQDASRTSLGEPIQTNTHLLRWSVTHPLTAGFSIRVSGATQHADSNMGYEATYRYNYTSAHYFAGFTWEL